MLFAIIVFGVLSDNGTINGYSIFNANKKVLHFLIGVGVTAFLVAILLFSLRLVNEVRARARCCIAC